MEPSGRNRWQPVASGSQPKAAQIGETVAVGCHRLPETFHGKEGVSGSSPAEASLYERVCGTSEAPSGASCTRVGKMWEESVGRRRYAAGA
jgi:hypothetical protein